MDLTHGAGGAAGLKGLVILALLAFMLLQACPSPLASGRMKGDPEGAPGAPSSSRVLVGLDGELDSTALGGLRALGIEPLRLLPHGLLECAAAEGYHAASAPDLPGIRWIEGDVTFRAAAVPPDDPDYPLQWNLEDIGAEGAWTLAGGGSENVVVAVLDSGVAYRDHEDGLKAPDLRYTRFVQGRDVYAGDDYPDDENGHGTLVTEVLASSFDNGFRAAGIAYGCSIMPVRVLGPDGAGASPTVAEGIYWAVDNGADVISLALAATQHSEAVGEAVRYAWDEGVLCIAAAGNEGSNPGYPGGMDCPADEGPYVLAVGATDTREERAHYSNYGDGLDLVAPGGDLTRDDNGDGFPDGVPQEGFWVDGEPQGGFALTWNEGTSLAVPQVAAAAALLLSFSGSLTPSQLTSIITSTCRDLGTPGKDIYYGSGMLDMPAALSAAVSSGWYFAEGTTLEGFDQWFCVANPNNESVEVEFAFFQEDGTVTSESYDIAPRTRFTLSANDVVGEGLSFATRIFSDRPVVAERPMYFNYKGEWSGGSAVMGAQELSRTWYFAEGYTERGRFDTYLCLLNPWTDPTRVTVGYILNRNPQGTGYVEKVHVIPGGTRLTLLVNEDAAYDSEVSTAIDSERPIVAERPMYFNYRDKWNGGHDVVGATAPANQWYFAEGTTRAGFETWLCLANPGTNAATVTVEYILGQGQGPNVTRDYPVGAGSRYTIDVNREAGAGKDVSLEVASTQPIVAERPMYFDYADKWDDGHDVVGATAPGTGWYFAEGTTRAGFETWLCLANPGTNAATVTVDYLLGQGQGTNITRTYYVPAGTRYTILVNTETGPEKDVSMQLNSTQPIVAERPMYFLYGNAWDGGHDVLGSRVP